MRHEDLPQGFADIILHLMYRYTLSAKCYITWKKDLVNKDLEKLTELALENWDQRIFFQKPEVTVESLPLACFSGYNLLRQPPVMIARSVEVRENAEAVILD